ncbi:hypothetical protein RB597_010188 [Gaeumannomyces tritici]
MSMPNPNTTTRRVFTQFLVEKECPDNADPYYKKTHDDLRRLLDLLAKHEGMSANMEQTFMMPAADKNKVYFMWDFVGRTLGMMAAVPPTTPKASLASSAMFKDIIGRTVMAEVLIRDTTGKLDDTNEPAHRGSYRRNVEFGPEIIQALDEAKVAEK